MILHGSFTFRNKEKINDKGQGGVRVVEKVDAVLASSQNHVKINSTAERPPLGTA